MTSDSSADSDRGSAETVEFVSGTGIPVRGNDIDTDQIIPARFLKAVTFEGLGQFAFFDQRFTEEDEEKEHPFNEDRFRGASVLAVNANFGCGSSREHAPQALMRWGIDAIVGESFAGIFQGNCLALGIPALTASHEEITALQDWIDEHPDGEIEVDVAAETVTYGDTTIEASVDEAQRRALVEGEWDTTALMDSNAGAVRGTAESLPYVTDEHLPGASD
ncbi:3-isopropylmalate dehydratase small subunit [Halorarum salinum]|uniref:3-isopropylmalate dehydratase n=1 Tax=Halorarum salinum TaxID=2743089 RepID=A0A7D5QC31_9EURY|nr:3-isopropylmalate dehydratase small subunit [Halobaculum salinum]QLG63497.1 3-isopropylmalate dehydratase small subunit [Halobaculum salinum]